MERPTTCIVCQKMIPLSDLPPHILKCRKAILPVPITYEEIPGYKHDRHRGGKRCSRCHKTVYYQQLPLHANKCTGVNTKQGNLARHFQQKRRKFTYKEACILTRFYLDLWDTQGGLPKWIIPYLELKENHYDCKLFG